MKTFTQFNEARNSDENFTVRLSQAAFDNLYSLEVDTYDPSTSPKEKRYIANGLEKAKKKGNSHVMTLPRDKKIIDYFMSALDNGIDIAKDIGDRKIITAYTRIQKQLKSM